MGSLASKPGLLKRRNLTTNRRIADGLLQHDERIVWEGGPTISLVWKFWIGIIYLILGLIIYESVVSTLETPAFLPFFLFLDSLSLILPFLALARFRSAQRLSYYITTQRIIIERGNRFRWLFFPEIGDTRTSDRASLVTLLGLRNVYFQSKGAEKVRRWTPDEHGIVYALRKDEHGTVYEYPPRPVTTDGFYYLTKTEANYVKQLVQSYRQANSSR